MSAKPHLNLNYKYTFLLHRSATGITKREKN